MDIQARLAERGLKLPVAPKPVAAYVPAVHLVFVSGQLPMLEGKLLAQGAVPTVVSVAQGKAAAQQCALNALAVLGDQIGGDWSRLVRIVRLGVFVASADSFADQAQVANGASELLADLFGDAGRHARAAVGVNALPLGATVELELLAQVK
jgi:enamine deaminase RidA (YjgF/YER057c/UK114 family)